MKDLLCLQLCPIVREQRMGWKQVEGLLSTTRWQALFGTALPACAAPPGLPQNPLLWGRLRERWASGLVDCILGITLLMLRLAAVVNVDCVLGVRGEENTRQWNPMQYGWQRCPGCLMPLQPHSVC